MKKILICIAVALSGKITRAQIIAEVFGAKDQSIIESWWNQPLGDSSKFSFFNYTRWSVAYATPRQTQFMNYATLNYDLGRGWSLAGGGFAGNEGFLPVLGFNYFFVNDTWLVNAFPGVVIKSKPDVELFFFAQFRPKLGKKTKLFSQVVANSNFNFRKHNFSEQAIRVGMDTRGFQWGLGVNTVQMPGFSAKDKMTLQVSPGFFIRREF
jgi:hypothetical protein